VLTKEQLSVIATGRRTAPEKLGKVVRGDLDWIVMKCLEKDRMRRYETANGLARDIERHLNSEPVVARPPSRIYSLQKSIRRNRLVYAATATVILSLLLGWVLRLVAVPGKESRHRAMPRLGVNKFQFQEHDRTVRDISTD
jgi:hypothetical protein